MRRFMLIVSLFVLLPGIMPTRADDPHEWTAWLHYGRHMTLVNSAGESLREVELPLPENNPGDYVISLYIAVSHNGDLIAYVAQAQTTHSNHVMIYDSQNQALILDYALPDLSIVAPFISNNDAVFNSDDTAVALSYTIAAPIGQQGSNYIGIISLATGTMVNKFNSSDVASTYSYFPVSDRIWYQIIQHYKGSEVTFALMVETSTYPNSKRFSFVWNVTTGIIHQDTIYTLLNDTFEPTGEVIARIETDDFSTIGLQVYDPIIHASYPFYLSKDIREARFIQNGERILVGKFNNGSELTLVERNGEVADQWRTINELVINSLSGIPDGFLYTTYLDYGQVAGEQIVFPALLAVNTRDNHLDAGQTIWHLSFQEYAKRAGGNNVPLEIVWEHDDMPPSAYKAWAQLAAPVYEPTPAAPENLPPPTMIPPPEPLFQVGMTVRVQTIGGEILNLRRDHTRKSDVIMYLENKMRLTLLEGPVESEGFTWWRVRTADGVEGWTVENNGDLQTLMPA